MTNTTKLKVNYFDGTYDLCDTIEFCYDGRRVLLNGCEIREIREITTIVPVKPSTR